MSFVIVNSFAKVEDCDPYSPNPSREVVEAEIVNTSHIIRAFSHGDRSTLVMSSGIKITISADASMLASILGAA